MALIAEDKSGQSLPLIEHEIREARGMTCANDSDVSAGSAKRYPACICADSV